MYGYSACWSITVAGDWHLLLKITLGIRDMDAEVMWPNVSVTCAVMSPWPSVIIKKGIKRIGTNEQGSLIRPPGAQEPSVQQLPTGMMVDIDHRHLYGILSTFLDL